MAYRLSLRKRIGLVSLVGAAMMVLPTTAMASASNGSPAAPQAAKLAPAAAHVAATPSVVNPVQCQGGADYGWFCAYSGPNFTGESIGMYTCGNYSIPWVSTGSWDNEQTPGTRPWLYWVTNPTPWHMPAADSYQRSGVDWGPVLSITNC